MPDKITLPVLTKPHSKGGELCRIEIAPDDIWALGKGFFFHHGELATVFLKEGSPSARRYGRELALSNEHEIDFQFGSQLEKEEESISRRGLEQHARRAE